MSKRLLTAMQPAGLRLSARRSGAWLSMLMLTGCASSGGGKPGVVLDSIHREIASAAQPPVPKTVTAAAVEAALLPPLQLEPAKKAQAEARFDISVQNAPAAQVFMAIVEGTPFSMLVPPEVTGGLTLSLKDVTVRDVLDTIRDLYGYDYRLDGTRIFIQPNTLQTRIFEVNYLAGKRNGSTNVSLTSTAITSNGGAPSGNAANGGGQNSQPGNTSGSGSTNSGGANVQTQQKSDFWGDIDAALKAIVGTEGGRKVVLNLSSGVILVSALPAELRNVEKYLRTTQLVVERQVMLEAKIIEVGLSEQFQAGVNWASFGRVRSEYAGTTSNMASIGGQGGSTILGATGTMVSGGASVALAQAASSIATGLGTGFYGLAFQSANFAALLSFLESQGSVHVLSSPRVATMNNQKAVLKVGSDEFFVTNVTTTTTSGTGATTTSPSVTLQPFFSGIALDVTPQIDDNDQIILHVHPSVSTVFEKTKTINLGAGGSLSLPLAASSVNESDSIVRVKDGHIVAIGGLMRQRQTGDRSGLPGTTQQDLTVLGQRDRTLQKSELVILIRPVVIRQDADWRNGLLEAQTRLQEYAPSAPVRIIGH